MYIFAFKLYFAQKHNLKKRCLYHQNLLTFFMRCRIFEICSNDNIHNSMEMINIQITI